MSDSQPPKPKLRWYQFSLRTLLIVTLIAAIGFAWVGYRIQRVRNQISATAELEKLGADIGFYSQVDWNELPTPDRWLWKCFDDNPVHYINSSRTPITDTNLKHLKELTNLRVLKLVDTQVTDNGLEYLKGLTSLQALDLKVLQVTDAGLENIKGLTNLQELWLEGTQVTDTGLEHLKGLRRLFTLSLSGTQVTDTGLEHLKRLSLHWLDLSHTQVTDAGWSSLRG
ncbi:MAG: hypothetical protein JXM70_04305 [Pirellulales bacterium]|nr:hypothetical protein [Pirellulales bacterium]